MRFIFKTICFVVCFFAVLAMGLPLLRAQAQLEVSPLTGQAIADFLPEKDLIEMLCLTSRWQTAEFLSRIVSYQELITFLPEKFPDQKINYDSSNLSQYPPEAPAKIAAVCESPTYAQGLNNFNNLVLFAKNVNAELRKVDQLLEDNQKQRIEALLAKISSSQKSSLKNLIKQEKTKKERDLAAWVNQAVKKAEDELSQDVSKRNFSDINQGRQYATYATEQMKLSLENQLIDLALRAEDDLKQKLQVKAIEFLGKEIKGFDPIIKESQKIKDLLNSFYEAKIKIQTKEKIEALAKWAQVADLFLEKEIAVAKKQGFSENKNIIDELIKIKQALKDKSQIAVSQGNERDFLSAIEEARDKRGALSVQAPELFSGPGGAQNFCSEKLVFLKQQAPNLQKLLLKIEKVEVLMKERVSRCQNKFDIKGCTDLSNVANNLAMIKKNITDFIAGLAGLEQKCVASATENQPDLESAIDELRISAVQVIQGLAVWKQQWPQYKTIIK